MILLGSGLNYSTDGYVQFDGLSSYIQISNPENWIADEFPGFSITYHIKFPTLQSGNQIFLHRQLAVTSTDKLQFIFNFYSNGTLQNFQVSIQGGAYTNFSGYTIVSGSNHLYLLSIYPK